MSRAPSSMFLHARIRAALVGILVVAWAGPSRADRIPPARVTDLVLLGFDPPAVYDERCMCLEGRFILRWTAPGDDGTTGCAWRYEFRMRPLDLNRRTWNDATEFRSGYVPLPSASGLQDSIVIGRLVGIETGTRYAIGLRVYDEVGNEGAISNVVAFTTPGTPPVIADTVDIGKMQLYVSGKRVEGPRIVCKYEHHRLTIGKVRLVTEPLEWEFTEANARQVHGAVPYVHELVEKGVSYREASYRFQREIDRVVDVGYRVLRQQGWDAVADSLLKFSLVERVEKGTFYMKGSPIGFDFMDDAMGKPAEQVVGAIVSLGPNTPNADWAQRVIFDAIRYAPKRHRSMSISRAGIFYDSD